MGGATASGRRPPGQATRVVRRRTSHSVASPAASSIHVDGSGTADVGTSSGVMVKSPVRVGKKSWVGKPLGFDESISGSMPRMRNAASAPPAFVRKSKSVPPDTPVWHVAKPTPQHTSNGE